MIPRATIDRMIYYDKVSKRYPDKSVALDNVSFGVEPKEFVTIVGQSGAGKTTLIKMLIAEDRPSEGNVYFESTDIHKLSKRDMGKLRRRIGTVFQEYRLIPNKTVYENIAFAMEATGRTDSEIAADVPHVLELVDLGHKIWNFPGELSGGERQRVAIARAIVTQPDIIVADEPTGNLDPTNTFEIVRILQKINELGTTVLLTTHNKGVVDTVGGRIITMEKGKIVRDDKNGKYIL
jgi:cell division transport system ATP-binding protein